MMASFSVLTGLLLLFSLSSTSLAVLVQGSEEKEQEHTQTISTTIHNNNNKLVSFPLLPGDSSEAQRRRRRHRRNRRRQLLRRRLDKASSSSSSEEQQAQENPLDLTLDALYEGYGVHYVDLWVGQPFPQRVTTIVDTGSSVTGFPCTGCKHCGGSSSDDHDVYHTDKVFRPEDSTTFLPITSSDQCLVGHWKSDQKRCRTSRHYSEGSSWDAFEAIDQVCTGGNHAIADSKRVHETSFPLHFGCQDKVTGLFETQLADGIMGLYNSRASFWNQMYHAKKIENKAFSLCFSAPRHVDRKGTPAGAMVLGGSDTRLHKTPMAFAQQLSDDGKYVLHLEKVYLLAPKAGKKQQSMTEIKREQWNKVQIFEEDLNNRGDVILDSGTTATYLTKTLQRHFVQVFNSIVPEDVMELDPDEDNNSYKLSQAQIDQYLPTIVFQMKAWDDSDDKKVTPSTTTTLPSTVGTDLDGKHAGKSIVVGMPPSSYLGRIEDDDEMDNPDDPNEVCHWRFNFYMTKRKGKGGVLGANFMRGHDVLFDIDNSRIGFAPSDCEYATLAKDEESG